MASSPDAKSSASLPRGAVPGAHELLALLDREIDLAHRRFRWPGWTPWALISALAALLWGIVGRIDRIAAPQVVFRSAAFTMMVAEVLRRGRSYLSGAYDLAEDGRVLVTSEFLRDERPAFALELILATALLWGVESFTGGVAPWANAVVLAWVLLMGLSAIAGLVYSFWPVPSPVGPSALTPVALVLNCFTIVFPAIGAYAYITSIDGPHLQDARIGILMGAAAVVLHAIAREPEDPPLAIELVELRRGVALGSLPIAEAMKHATIILRGLKLEDYVQQDARRMLVAIASLKGALADFRPVLQDIRRHADLFERGQVPDDTSWNKLMNDWEQRGDAADRQFQQVERWHRRYRRRLKFAAAVAGLARLPYEGQALLSEMRPHVDRVMSEYKQVGGEYRAALSRLENALRAVGALD